jgi:hypothetical protein
MVTAAPLEGFTDPLDVIRISPELLVVTGVVVAVLMSVSAAAGAATMAKIEASPLDARRSRIRIFPVVRRRSPPDG